MTSPRTDRPEPLLEVRNLRTWFPIKRGIFSRTVGHVKAVDDISFEVYPNETLGLVGESGCGKTTVGRTILRLLEPTEGEARFQGQDLFRLKGAELRKMRRHMQIIFQDPYSSLNPRMTVDTLIGDAMELHGIARGDARRKRVKELLERVGLQPSYINRYPHEFSGGQRQRIGIARALALEPDFIVCDEAVSALDVSVQAQIINLLKDLQGEFKLSFLFIAHDLSVVHYISDRIAVMYLGEIVELADRDSLFANTAHPYTKALLSAIPQPVPSRRKKRIILTGDVPTPMNPPPGCHFHTRCPACFQPCNSVVPENHEISPGHTVRCHLYDPRFRDVIPQQLRDGFLVDLACASNWKQVVEEDDDDDVPTSEAPRKAEAKAAEAAPAAKDEPAKDEPADDDEQSGDESDDSADA